MVVWLYFTADNLCLLFNAKGLVFLEVFFMYTVVLLLHCYALRVQYFEGIKPNKTEHRFRAHKEMTRTRARAALL